MAMKRLTTPFESWWGLAVWETICQEASAIAMRETSGVLMILTPLCEAKSATVSATTSFSSDESCM